MSDENLKKYLEGEKSNIVGLLKGVYSNTDAQERFWIKIGDVEIDGKKFDGSQIAGNTFSSRLNSFVEECANHTKYPVVLAVFSALVEDNPENIKIKHIYDGIEKCGRGGCVDSVATRTKIPKLRLPEMIVPDRSYEKKVSLAEKMAKSLIQLQKAKPNENIESLREAYINDSYKLALKVSFWEGIAVTILDIHESLNGIEKNLLIMPKKNYGEMDAEERSIFKGLITQTENFLGKINIQNIGDLATDQKEPYENVCDFASRLEDGDKDHLKEFFESLWFFKNFNTARGVATDCDDSFRDHLDALRHRVGLLKQGLISYLRTLLKAEQEGISGALKGVLRQKNPIKITTIENQKKKSSSERQLR